MSFNIVKLTDPIQFTNVAGGLVPKGAYNAGTDYSVGDSVDYNGSSYVMYADAAAGTLPTDTTKWQVIANKGDTGATGADSTVPGPAGADGADGLTVSVNSVTQVAGDISLTQDNIPDGTTNKAYTATEQTKLAGIATGATANSSDATLLARANHTGTQSADTITDGTTNKVFTATEKTKLSGIAIGATANDTDANLKNRANHTGTQTASTISDFSTAADARVSSGISTHVAASDPHTQYQKESEKGSANGYAELDATGKVPSGQLPSFVDEVIEVANSAAPPFPGEAGKIYVTLDDNKTYRWGGSAYIEISSSLALGETSTTAYRGDRGKTAYDHSQDTSTNPHNVTKSQVGLGNVDNTSDATKNAAATTLTNKTLTTPILTAPVVNGSNGNMTISASSEGGEYNIGVDASGTLALYGAGGNYLNLELLDGGLYIDAGKLVKGTSSPPASAGAAGSAGQIEWDANYIYVCVANSTWKRTAISTW